MDWSDGYVTELEYTHGYYRELSPGMLRLGCLAAGIAPPAQDGVRYLELGYGQGLAVNVHAAATTGEYWGIDVNPSQAMHAAALAQASGATIRLLDQSFEQLAARDDLPQFDIIALHGVWSWVSDKNRGFITDIIRRHLRIGGIVYISYNAFPGWAPAMPVRHLLALHTTLAGAETNGTAGNIDAALGFVRSIADAGATYFASNPALLPFIEQVSGLSRNYIAHEYLNRDWRIDNFSDVCAAMQAAKLSFVTSAHALDHLDDYHLRPEGKALLAGIDHPVLRETVRDYLVNQQFRRDIFVKGYRRLPPNELRDAWLQQKFILTTRAEDVPLTVKGPLGELTFQRAVYDPILESLAVEAYAPKSVAQILSHPKLSAFDFGQLAGSLLVLTGLGHVQPAQTPGPAEQDRCRALNRHLCRHALTSGAIGSLAAPAVGGGIEVTREEQLLVLATMDGKETPAAQAEHLAAMLRESGEALVQNGKHLAPGPDTGAALKTAAERFRKTVQPLFRASGVL